MNQILDAGKQDSKANSGKRIVWVVTFAGVAILATAVGALLYLGYGVAPPASSTGTSVSESASSAASQTSEGGGVTVTVEWQGRNAGPVFTVTMDTHSIDLDSYDLSKMVVLKADGREALPLKWDAPKGGHHRKGMLTFSDKALDGAPLIGPGTRNLELVIYDVAGIPERAFKWTP